jgi:hypothetical protein
MPVHYTCTVPELAASPKRRTYEVVAVTTIVSTTVYDAKPRRLAETE